MKLTHLALVAALIPLLALSARAADEPAIKVDKEKKTVLIAAKIAPRKLAKLTEIYPIEVIAAWPESKGGQKAHETVVTIDVKPSDVHKALVELGLKPGAPAKGEGAQATGPEVKVSLDLPGPGGIVRRVAIEKVLVDRKTNKALPALKWHFTGSIEKQPDPTKPEKAYAADLSGTLIAVFPVTDETVLQTSLTMKEEPLIKMETNKQVLPAEGTPVTLVIEVK